MTHRPIVLVFALTALVACATFTSVDTLAGCRDRQTQWCPQVQRAAQEAFLYAQMASNSYLRTARFHLPDSIQFADSVQLDRNGFAANIYHVLSNGRIVEKVIAYRGTEFTSWNDWKNGNIKLTQNNQALSLFDSVRMSNPPGVDMVVTGHSLGGAMAMTVSLNRSELRTYVFNSSPHFVRGKALSNPRMSFAAYGDVLKVLRAPAINPSQLHTVIPCSGGGPVNRHYMDPFAACITQIAATIDTGALASLQRNSIAARPSPKDKLAIDR